MACKFAQCFSLYSSLNWVMHLFLLTFCFTHTFFFLLIVVLFPFVPHNKFVWFCFCYFFLAVYLPVNTLISLPIHEHRMSFHLFSFSSFHSATFGSFQHTILHILGYSYSSIISFNDIFHGIVFIISCLDFSFPLYINTTEFSVLILYLAILMN